MSEDDTHQMPSISAGADSTDFEHCEQCSAPVDRDQRYCVNCGNHRRHVPDPAARYLSRASAHTGARAGGVSGAVAGGAVVKGAPASHGGGVLGLPGALALALIPVAAVIGVAIGRSSNDQGSKILSAMQRAEDQTSTEVSTTPVASSSSGATAASSTSSTSQSSKRATKSKTKTKTASSGSGSSTSSNGSVSKIAGSKVTSSEQATGSQEAQKIQKSTGKSYVQGANSLPSQVVVGP